MTSWSGFDVADYCLGLGVFIGGVLQFVAQLPFLSQLKLVPRYKIAFNDPSVRRLLTLMLPLVFGALIGANQLLDRYYFCSSFAAAATFCLIMGILYGRSFLSGIFGIARQPWYYHICLDNLPSKPKQFCGRRAEGRKRGLLISLPAAISLALLATPILTTLFQYGHFTAEDVQKTAGALIAFSMGLMMFILIKVLAVQHVMHDKICEALLKSR